MGKRHRNLICKIANPENLELALKQTSKGKRGTHGYLSYKEYAPLRLDRLRERILDGGYIPGDPHVFWIRDPKYRPITALPFADRVVQHAINNVTFPIFSNGWMPQSYACIPGKGTHLTAIRVQAMIRQMHATGRPVWVLKTDYSKYFYTISREVLWTQYDAKISCRRTMDLLGTFTPHSGTGVPIGLLKSQCDANINGNLVDRFLSHNLKVPTFFRYMDDIVVLGHSRAVLEGVKDYLEWYSQHTLRQFFSRWSIQPAEAGVNFVGYRIFKDYKLLRKTSVRDAKRKIKQFVADQDWEGLQRFAASWGGHIKWADSYNLKQSINQMYLKERSMYANANSN